jgi:8-oxo-dGTP diphosphatase
MVDYDKVGLLTIRDGHILLCRKKRGTSLLILPGGCLEMGESAMDCLYREIAEELGPVQVSDLRYIATYRDQAAGSASKIVQIQLYEGALSGEPSPQSEIAELVWFGSDDDRTQLSPSLARQIVPDLIDRKILAWSSDT